MRQPSLIVLLFFCFHFSSYSQIEVKYDVDDHGVYNFYCINNDFCKYVIEVSFNQIVNLKSYTQFPYRVDVSPGRTNLFELKPGDVNGYSTCNYNVSFIKGCINPKVKQDFVYLLPIGIGKETEAYELKYFRINAKDPEPKDWYAIGLKLKLGDTIYAARRGIVISLRDTAKLGLSDYSYTSNDNYIEIMHDDCSFGRYQIFSHVLVKSGQKVEAGDPIGLAGGEKYTNGPHLRFSVYYNYEQQTVARSKEGAGGKKYWAYVPLVFYTRESKNIKLNYGTKYTSEHPDSLIIQEMSTRQIKKWEKNRNHNLR